jgi:hypothetical protein
MASSFSSCIRILSGSFKTGDQHQKGEERKKKKKEKTPNTLM